ncbi:sulfite exporter TauE/SafE family protein [Vibrio sp. SM6]|uniref:Sulfite exporter TauE/SafE family protein n=1 Tax=Vibrio agarilyticus TaxID=2726741 RepID=A0A7X8TPU8_9VIBR|nr:sulfite exporter TauE/SafE family protein [Vibrio agarilyticus]NLS12574.1 sulfite exporter TauE/SafE family protein [Vibrio agarilyticus]
MVNSDVIAALMMGLVGSGHCIGMCGGIASMLSMGSHGPTPKRVIIYYNVGRIISYALFGALVGGALASLTALSDLNQPLAWLRLVAAILMIAMGLYVGRWWFGLLKLERLGQSLWRRISPAAKPLLPLRQPLHALPLGFIWGWLPCGLVYSALSWAAVAGNASLGAATMAAFGLGTLPAMFAIGMSGSVIQRILKSVIFRHICAFFLVGYGVYIGYGALRMMTLLG